MTNQRKYSLLLWFLVAAFLVQGQSEEAEYIYNQAKHSKVATYQFDERFEYLVLASSFSKEAIRQIPFTDRRVIKIDLVYTTFSESSVFDQKLLDEGRLRGLIEINPQIVSNTFLDWNVIGQTGCASAATCTEYFHGFVIYYEPYFTKETALLEIDSINLEMTNLNQKIVEFQKLLKIDFDRIDCIYPESLYSQEKLSEEMERFYACDQEYKGRVFFEVLLDYKGKVKEVTVKGSLFPCKDKLGSILKHIFEWKRGLVIGRQQYDVKALGFVSFPLKKESVNLTGFEIPKELIEEYRMLPVYPQCIAYHTDTSYVDIFPKIEKKVVSSTLLRNKWTPDLIVVDVTGSMYPFTADLLKWIKLMNDDRPKSYVFFNDGNDKPTNQKVIGQTGGLFFVKTEDFALVRDKMFEAMRAGGGGDLPENNFEALMAGLKQANPSGDVIMIADNYSFPRDQGLLARYSGKLKIILCHTEKGINTDYLNLAKKHGFTLHTLESDISDFTKPKLVVEGIEYRQERGGFVRVSDR